MQQQAIAQRIFLDKNPTFRMCGVSSGWAPLLSFVSKMLNKLIGERDWPAQEVSHILLQLPVQKSSRALVSLDCRPEDLQKDLITLELGEIIAQRPVLQRYRDRLRDTANGNQARPHFSLFDCLRNWDWMTWRIRPRAAARVINYFPKYPKDPESTLYSDYFRVKLMLHHLFVDWTDLLVVDGRAYGSYIDAFRACSLSRNHPEDFYTGPDKEDDDTSDSETETEEDLGPDDGSDVNYPLANFEALARRQPREDFTDVDLGQETGTRDIDRNFNWSVHAWRHNIHPEIWDQIKVENLVTQVVTMDSSPDLLNLEQRKLYDTVVSQYENELAGQPLPQLLLYVDGVAGSGKTFALLKTCARIQDLAKEARIPNPVFRAALTGIAAFNIIKRTLHALLRLPLKARKSDLSIATLQSLQALFRNCIWRSECLAL
ncbi:hypothetical protein BGZ60DRAFT_508337 [Tricladium varicosporioides]|nr:hypothetical protein BGZ60DRAFT_508337 [Hymenoscyphus varicosporioides]